MLEALSDSSVPSRPVADAIITSQTAEITRMNTFLGKN
ncbi:MULTISPECIES: DUF305 domain-containing protein [unclassified Streptomyces]|nr:MULTISPECIES: DUF305 domain-containing protein [unclassified Streptomyces]